MLLLPISNIGRTGHGDHRPTWKVRVQAKRHHTRETRLLNTTIISAPKNLKKGLFRFISIKNIIKLWLGRFIFVTS